ncbi:hypothetical protein SHIRM173S_04244 [Streptomyces hirsutus]
MPRRSATPWDQSRVRGSINCVVEALVSSVPCSPVSQYVSRSGISSSRLACASWAVPRAAVNWYSVLNGAYCRPVTACSLPGGDARPHLLRDPLRTAVTVVHRVAQSIPVRVHRP